MQLCVELIYEGVDCDKGIELMKKIDVGFVVVDIGVVVDVLCVCFEVDGKFVVIGYCFGGQFVYCVVVIGKFDVVVFYYGGGIQNVFDFVGQVMQLILFYYVENDYGILFIVVDQVKVVFVGYGYVLFYVYLGVEYGFNCMDCVLYNQCVVVFVYGCMLMFFVEYF